MSNQPVERPKHPRRTSRPETSAGAIKEAAKEAKAEREAREAINEIVDEKVRRG